MPIARVARLILPRLLASPCSISGQVSPPAFTPRICFSWLVAISTPLAEMNPLMTGCDSRFARNPSRSKPSTTSITPESAASVIAASQYSAVPGAATAPAALAVISETTATGPTASVRLVPNTA